VASCPLGDVIEGAGFHGAVFDVDGVLVDSPHEQAWRVALDQLFETSWTSIREDATQYTSERFTPEVYRAHISGKPTISGARAALSYFGVPATDARTEEYARRKQRVMDELLRAGELTAYPDALRFVLAVRGGETPIAAASSSKNAARLLGQIRLDAFADREGLRYDFVRPGITLLDIFDADVSGRDFAHGGKPHPEIFLTAARELGVPADRCFAVEDAVAGVQAAKAADMAVIGLARTGEADALAAADADIIVSTLDEVDLPALRRAAWRGRRSRRTPSIDDRGGAPNSPGSARPRNERAKLAGPR
jgi:beta-phosphoglucomutase